MRVVITLFTLCFSFCLNAQNTSPYWSLSGNSTATPASKLGTTNDISLRFYTNNVQRMVIASPTGNVGIGISTLNTLRGKLSVLNNGSNPVTSWIGSGTPLFAGYAENTSGNGDFLLSLASNTASARPVYIGKRSRGTLAAPAIVASNDYLATLRAAAYDGSTFQNTAAIDFLVDGTPASGSVPTRISFATGSSTSKRMERMRIGSNGDVSVNGSQLFIQNATGNVGIGTATPNYKVDVAGTINAINKKNDTSAISIKAISAGYGIHAVSTGALDEDYEFEAYVGGVGVYGESTTDGRGMLGVSRWGTGVVGIGNGAGVEGFGTTGVEGISMYEGGQGVLGYGRLQHSYGVQGWSIYSHGIVGVVSSFGVNTYAGYFVGDVYTTGSYLPSALKLKQRINDMSSATTILSKLQPKEYEYKHDGNYQFMNLPKGRHFGLIAEDVEKVLPGLVKATKYESRMSEAAQSNGKRQNTDAEDVEFKAVNYTELIPIVIKGMQEQQQAIETLTKEVAELKEIVNKLVNGNNANASLSSASLSSANPNPVNGSTLISYNVPEGTKTAHLLVTDMKGSVVKQILLNSRGSSRITLNTAALAAGTYTYSLHVDGSKIDSKQLLIAR